MRVLHVINNLVIGGAERLIVEMLPRFSDKIDVELLVFQTLNNEFEYSLRNQGINITSLNSNSLYNPLILYKLMRIIKRYDIIHVHLFPAQYWVVLASFFLKKRPILLTTEHSTSNKRRNNYFLKKIDQFIYKYYSVITAISSAVNLSLTDHLNFKINKITTIENGVDIAKFKEAHPISVSDFNVKETDFIVVMIASFRPAKDQETLIRSISYLSSDIVLLLVGEGPKRVECENLVMNLNISSRVHFLGNREDVPSILKTADLCVISSIWEGFGLVAVEAMASGKPIIATSVDGLKDVVQGAGRLFEVSNVEQLAAIIQEIKDSPLEYKRLVALGNKRAKEYNINNSIDKHIILYQKLYCKKNKLYNT